MAVFSSQQFPPDSLASRGEQAARLAYSKRGYRIFGTNLYNPQGKRRGEIDLVALSDYVIVFVEVKTRSRQMDRFGGAAHAITATKRQKLRRVIELFLLHYPQFRHLRPQVDICLVRPSALDNRHFFVTILSNTVLD